MTFTEHLSELRVRIIRCAIAVVVCVLLCFALNRQILDIVIRPLQVFDREHARVVRTDGEGDVASQPPGQTAESAETTPPEGGAPAGNGKAVRMQVLNPLEPFLVSLKLSAYAGLVLALPYVIYQICAFVFPGLKPNERKAAQFLLVGSSILCILGVCMAYFVVFPLVIPYLVRWAPANVDVGLRLNETVALIIQGVLGFAVAFQFPMAMLILMYLGIISPEALSKWRRVAIVGIAFGAAVFTPPDPFSMIMMGVPLWLLYEASIVLGRVLLANRRKQAAREATAESPQA